MKSPLIEKRCVTRLQRRMMMLIVSTSLGAMLLAGCGPSRKPELKVFPVSGRVLVNGKPPVRAEIRLRAKAPAKDPSGRLIEPCAQVRDDGTFQVATYGTKDGAPPGEYALTIVWPVITFDGGEDVIGPDQLNGRFNNPAAPIAVVHVEAQDNQIPPIELNFN